MLDRKENINQETPLSGPGGKDDGKTASSSDIQKIKVSKVKKPEMLLIKRSAINSIISTGISNRDYDNESFEDNKSLEGPPKTETVPDKDL